MSSKRTIPTRFRSNIFPLSFKTYLKNASNAQ
jgi:hypothetical protein